MAAARPNRSPRLEPFVGSITVELGGKDHPLDHPHMAGAGDQPPADGVVVV